VDARRFDHLVVALTNASSRRSAVPAVIAIVLSSGLMELGSRPVAALAGANQPCSQDTQRESGLCFRSGRCRKNGKFSGKCRCACNSSVRCPDPLGCCGLSDTAALGLCKIGADQTGCKTDIECCRGVCRDGRCCFPAGSPANQARFCCSGTRDASDTCT
jgi:hypothetical protein